MNSFKYKLTVIIYKKNKQEDTAEIFFEFNDKVHLDLEKSYLIQ